MLLAPVVLFRKLNVAGAVAQRVTQMPEGAFLFLEHDLGVGNGGLTVRAPVDDARCHLP